jgi:hypothetical protein
MLMELLFVAFCAIPFKGEERVQEYSRDCMGERLELRF